MNQMILMMLVLVAVDPNLKLFIGQERITRVNLVLKIPNPYLSQQKKKSKPKRYMILQLWKPISKNNNKTKVNKFKNNLWSMLKQVKALKDMMMKNLNHYQRVNLQCNQINKFNQNNKINKLLITKNNRLLSLKAY